MACGGRCLCQTHSKPTLPYHILSSLLQLSTLFCSLALCCLLIRIQSTCTSSVTWTASLPNKSSLITQLSLLLWFIFTKGSCRRTNIDATRRYGPSLTTSGHPTSWLTRRVEVYLLHSSKWPDSSRSHSRSWQFLLICFSLWKTLTSLCSAECTRCSASRRGVTNDKSDQHVHLPRGGGCVSGR